ncbi:P-loop containing nucleoside triphosphate hydrolase protein [Whalleya microplaca]|nr:P-loop containing nucleoside triphosphate hydrolase protein [Whalleya microplaca]
MAVKIGNSQRCNFQRILLDRIEMLEEENRALKCQLHCSTRTPKWQVFHFIPMPGEEGSNEIQNQTYIGQPSWDITPHREPRIKGNHLVADPKGYMFRNNIDFAINKFYSATRSANLEKAIRDNECLPAPDPVGETIDLFSDQMIDAFQSFFFARNDHKDKFPRLNVDEPLQAPFLWWYHYRTGNIFQGMAPHHRVLMNALTDWIDENYGLDYDRVDDQLSRGVVTQLAMHYLVRPGDVLITRDRKTVTASLALSWAEFEQPKPRSPHNLLHEPHKPDEETKGEWLLKSWAYEYDGSFYRKQVSIRMNPFKGPEDEFPITSLEAFPLRFAGDEVRNRLDARGSMIWSCRQKKLVTYKDDENGSYSQFMIDYATYKRLHPDSKMPLVGRTTETKYVSQAVMDRDEPPAAPERYIFPNNIIGYNLRAKKWVDLEVDLIQEVAWNKKAFENLVVDEETKDLVKALVMDQLEAERGTDLIRNKGNGLIMLLHGSPGTGKTFTAESVAEMAEKPLYSVTCGDIGTEPEKVEKYLQSVLHLGKIWNCVVLIDEAEVFLEQRTLSDLTRNALVSVFLRVLEYYDGILNLTSNRMGTFDEAFKSRILLSLHYEPLGKEQRRQVWRNFFSHLQSLDEQNIDFDDIECYIDDLADYPINGREIRNSITTARKLAQYKGKKMKFAHLQHAIKVASKFDTYLKSVHQGFDDDLIARGEGIR